MARLADWLNSAVSSKSELEKEMEGGEDPAGKNSNFTWGFFFLCFGGLWAIFELVRAILFFF